MGIQKHMSQHMDDQEARTSLIAPKGSYDRRRPSSGAKCRRVKRDREHRERREKNAIHVITSQPFHSLSLFGLRDVEGRTCQG